METLESMDAIAKHIEGNDMALLYLSRPSCGVCVVLKPKVQQMVAQRFPHVVTGYVDLDQVPEAAGQYSIFSIPGILVFIQGRESIREARNLGIEQLAEKIERPYGMLFS